MKKKVKLNESKLKNIISRIIKEEFSDATTFNKSLWVIVPNDALEEIKSKGGLYPNNPDSTVAISRRKGVYLCNDKNAIQAYCKPNSSYVEVDLGKLMSSLKGTRNANIEKRDFHGSVLYIVPYVPSDCISSVEPCGGGGQLQEEKHLNKLTESDLHKIVKESVNMVLKEVSLKGKSGEEYSLHGDNFDSWGTLAKLRKHQLNTPNRVMTGREEDAYKRDDDNSTNLMIDYALMNNKRGRAVDRLMDIADKTSGYISKDIINNYGPKVESKQHRR